jgi:cell division protein FtsI (penicillin-binding protein 3)
MAERLEQRKQQVAESPGTRGRDSDRRIFWLKAGLLALFAVVVIRLLQIQVLESSKYREAARKQYEAKVPLPAFRGNICDRNGKVLVSNQMTVSFAADPKKIGDGDNAIAERFSRVFGRPVKFYQEKLADESRRFVYLERRMNARYSRVINALEKEGLVEIKEPRRLYHYERIGGQVIGFTDIDDNGLSGIELSLDRYLRGTDGYVVMQRDGLGEKRPAVDYPRLEQVNGFDVTLTIDIEYQAIAEEELARGIEHTQAESGLVIMMDPATGEILAMANYPPIDPSDVGQTSQASLRNRTITDVFEPGSVFKLVTASAALEKGVVKLDQKFFAEQGTWMAPLANGKKQTITDTHPYGVLTFQEAIENSSNIVFAKISEKVGAEALYTMARRYGFGVETGVDIPGEVNGALKKPNEWSGTTLRTMAYGYEVGITPIQLVAAYAVVANKGVLMKPFVVRRVVDGNQECVLETRPQVVRSVISPAIVQTLTRCFEGVVDRGTAKAARLPGMKVAGKTGTSRKYIDGKYERGTYTASFVGFFPSDVPKVVCLVMLDHPKAGEYTGGQVSAPIFREIALKVSAISSRFSTKEALPVASGDGLVVPDVVNLAPAVAQGIVRARGLKATLEGKGAVVTSQAPRAGAVLARGESVKLITEDRVVAAAGYCLVPNLRGMPLRRAITSLTSRQFNVAVNGSGVVVSQVPEAGQQVRPGTRVIIRCEPHSRMLLTMN